MPNVIITTSCVCRDTTTNVASSCSPVGPPPTGTVRTCTSVTTPDPDVVTTCSLVPGANQTVSAGLSETLGHSFDFFAPGIGGMGDTHIIQVQERLHQTTANGGTAMAVIGAGTLKVDAVNVKN